MAKEPHPQDCGVWFFFRVLALGIIACLLPPAVRLAARAGLIGITRPARHHSTWRGSGKKAASTTGGAAFLILDSCSGSRTVPASGQRRRGASSTLQVLGVPQAVRRGRIEGVFPGADGLARALP